MDDLQLVLTQRSNQDIHDQDFHALKSALDAYLPQTQPSILDIGANRGQSIVSIKLVRPDAKILSFEANPRFWPTLEALAEHYNSDVQIKSFGLGKETTTLNFYVPVANGVEYLEEASTRLDYFEKPWVVQKFKERGGLDFNKTEVSIMHGDSLNLPNIDLIKIDVEGAELDVIRGLTNTITKNKPVLLVENSDFHNVTAQLKLFGYAPYQYQSSTNQLIKFHEACTNTFYLPT